MASICKYKQALAFVFDSFIITYNYLLGVERHSLLVRHCPHILGGGATN
jgi:hypothetical protein